MSFDHTWPMLVIDCKWNEWGVWGKCDGVCGYRYRSRTSVGPFFGGKACLERDSVDKRPCKWVKVDGVTKRCRECFSPIKLKGLIMSILWNDSHFVSKPSIVDGKNGPSGVIATKKITRERERGKSGPYYDGKDCQGESIEYLPCDWVAAVDCYWHPWGEWEGLASMHQNHSIFRTTRELRRLAPSLRLQIAKICAYHVKTSLKNWKSCSEAKMA